MTIFGFSTEAINRRMFLALLPILLCCGMLQVQAQTMMPLPGFGSNYTSTQIRGYWFQAPTDFTIVGLRVPTDIGTTPQNIQIIRFNSGPRHFFQRKQQTTRHLVFGQT